MAITNRIDLSGFLNVESGCTKVVFSDTTGFKVTSCTCDQNDNGYGLTGGIALDDITTAQLNVYYPGITTAVTFDFIIASHVITSCIFTDLNAVTTNITSLLASTVFPLNDFELTLSTYGITLPKLNDGIIKWYYTIAGVSSGESFTYTTSDEVLSSCQTDCCISNMYLDIDVNCECSESKINKIIEAEVFLAGAKYAMATGLDSKAEAMLNEANKVCDSNCKDC